MKAEHLLVSCVLGLACFIGGQTVGTRRLDAARVRPSDSTAAGAADGAIDHATGAASPERAASGHVEERVVADPLTEGERMTFDAESMRRRLAPHTAGTYLDALLLARDSALARWPDHIARPLRVQVIDAPRLEGWTADFLPVVRDAFATWTQAGLPVRFTFTADSALADIRVRFVERFASGISGKTVWSRDARWWLVRSDIQLAVQHPAGGAVSPSQMRAIALHEVGHLLGLDHSPNADDIMAPRVRVRELSEADKATIRLVYSVPAGSLR